MEIRYDEYCKNNHWLRWIVLTIPTTWTMPFEVARELLVQRSQWLAENCKGGYVYCGAARMAFEDRREAMQFKLVFG